MYINVGVRPDVVLSGALGWSAGGQVRICTFVYDFPSKEPNRL
jgi:hypothetical protein